MSDIVGRIVFETNRPFIETGVMTKRENAYLRSANTQIVLENQQLLDTITRLRSELDQARGMVEVARNGFLAIQKATIEGRVCDDVAWFSNIETLHDFCAHIADRLAVASTERADG